MAVGARGEKCKSSFRAVDFKDDGEQVRQLQERLQVEELEVEEVLKSKDPAGRADGGCAWGALGLRAQGLSAVPESIHSPLYASSG